MLFRWDCLKTVDYDREKPAKMRKSEQRTGGHRRSPPVVPGNRWCHRHHERVDDDARPPALMPSTSMRST